MRLRIVFSNYDALGNPYYGGGGARAIHEIAKRLAVTEETTVITGSYPGAVDALVDGVQYIRIGPERLGPKLGQLCFQVLLLRQLRRRDFDVWVESFTPPFSTACLQLFTRKPVVGLTQILSGSAMARKYKLPFAFMESCGLKTYRYAIALTGSIGRQVEEANPKIKVAVIPNGVDPSLIESPVSKEWQHLLFLGRIDVEQKGLDLLLDAFNSIAASTSAKLLIAGAGNPKDEAFLRRRIAELGLRGRVEMSGRVAGQQKEELFRSALCLVMPSRFEGVPLVLLEAFCYQTPAVVFDLPDFAWVPTTCCVKAKPFSEIELGRAMLWLATDSSARLAMGLAAKALVKDYSWDMIAKKYMDFLVSVVKNK